MFKYKLKIISFEIRLFSTVHFKGTKKMMFSYDRVTTKTVKKLKIVKLKMSIVILGHYMKSVITE